MSILQGFLSYKGVYLYGAFPVECLPYRGVHLTLVSGLWGVHFTGVSILQGFRPERGVCITVVFILQGCVPCTGVYSTLYL